jgi:hypothetical protein
MEAKTLPEVESITALITGLRHNGESQQPAIALISTLFAGDKASPADGLLELIRVVNYLPALVADLPPGGPQRVGANVAERIKRLVDPETLGMETRAYVKRNLSNFEFIEDTIHIFHDMHFDGEAFIAKTADLYSFIDEMKGKFGLSESLSDASKTVLFAQLDLLRSSVHRFQTSGVGPFRDSVFSIYGRIVLELNADKTVTETDKRQIIDEFLRFYDLSQAVGSLLKLGAPFIAGYLTHAS